MRKYLILLLAILIPGVALSQSDISVQTGLVTEDELAVTTTMSGVVISRQDAAIASELEGKLVWIAEVGERFERGDVVAELDTQLIKLEMRDRKAEIMALEANLDWLKRQTKRLDELAASNNTARSELDETRARYLVLQQELIQAEVSLERTSYDLERAIVRAPFEGIVASRAMSAGEYASVGRPLLRLVNTSAAEISVMAPLRMARFSQAGDTVTLTNGEQTARATVRSLITVGDLRSHMMELRLLPQSNDWLIGEAVTVELPAAHRVTQTTVSRDAVVLRDRSSYVYVVQEDLTAQRVDVKLGAGIGERIAVSGPLQAGDRVIIRGAERLRDGQKVQPLNQQVSMR